MSDLVIPPMPDHPPAIGPTQADWWDQLYNEKPHDTHQPLRDEPDNEEQPQPARWPWGTRLPDWRKGETIDLDQAAQDHEHADEPELDDEAETDNDDAPDGPNEHDEADDESDPDHQEQPGKPAARTWHRPSLRPATAQNPGPAGVRLPNARLRAIAFNGTAAGAGYALGLTPWFGQYLPAAETAVFGTVGMVLAAGGAWCAWKSTGLGPVRGVLPFAPVSRVVLTVLGAEFGRRLAPIPIMWLNTHGAPCGLGPTAISLLLTCATICGALWSLTVRPTRHWPWPGRWAARIPLASALLAIALYAPGAIS